MLKISSSNVGNPITYKDAQRFYKLAILGDDKRLMEFAKKLVEKSIRPALVEMNRMGVKNTVVVSQRNILDITQTIVSQVVSKDEVPNSLLQVINSLSEYKNGNGRFSLRGQTGASVVAHVIARSQQITNHQNGIAVNVYSEVWLALNKLATEQLMTEVKAHA